MDGDRVRLELLFRGTFEVQAGNRPLQGQSKPSVLTGSVIVCQANRKS